MYNNPFKESDGVHTEIKGLDLVWRDWCPLSKIVGNRVLEIILHTESIEDTETKLRQVFTEVATNLKENNYPLKEYIITKQLTRAPSDYQNSAAYPHVEIGKWMQQ